MLRRLELKNFRRHEDLVMAWQPGIIALRGNNEAGKSSVLEAVAYGFFGTRACRESLDDVVTWGKPVASLSVRLVFEVDGVEYTIVRSKAGAELTYGDTGAVTGQNEVSNFVGRLFGAPADVASSLWLVNQGAIRGALLGGSKSTSQLIEQLADFELLERVITCIQDELATGNTRPYEERLKQAQEFVDNLSDAPEPSVELAEAVKTAERAAQSAGEAAERASIELAKYDDSVLRPLLARRDRYNDALTQASRREKDLEAKQAELAKIAVPEYSPQAHQHALAELARAQDARKAHVIWTACRGSVDLLPPPNGVQWDGDAESFATFVKTTEALEAKLRKEQQEASTRLALAVAEQVHASICGMCGQDVSQLPEAIKRNEAASASIAQAEADLKRIQGELDDACSDLNACRHIQSMSDRYRKVIDRYADQDLLIVEDTRVPPIIRVKSPPPAAAGDQNWDAEVKRFADLQLRANAAEAQQTLLKRQVQSLTAELSRFEEALAAVGHDAAELDRVLSVSAELTSAKVRAEEAAEKARAAAAQLSAEYTQQLQKWEALQSSRVAGIKMRDDAQAALTQVNWNNALLKKVRGARPAIVDRLWTTVLASVSYYFSQIRGTQSTVTRSDGGFLVDGRAIDGLSGSTLDSLGLAIRLALLKTFLPRCSFIVLDEPAAACDEEREAAMLGTVAAAHFEQTVIVSHSELVDTFASQLVVL